MRTEVQVVGYIENKQSKSKIPSVAASALLGWKGKNVSLPKSGINNVLLKLCMKK